MENEKGKISIGLLIGIAVASLLVISAIILTVSLYYSAPKEVKEEVLEGGSINLTYSDDESSLNITSVTVADDINGMKINKADSYFDFSVVINLNEASQIDYELSVTPSKETTIPAKNIKVYLEKYNSGSYVSLVNPTTLKLNSKKSDLGSKIGSMPIYSNSTKKSLSENYRLRAWVDSTSNYTVNPTDKIVLDVEVHGKAS